MNEMHSALYFGEVVHQRVRPLRHGLRYRVFFTYVDVDELSGYAVGHAALDS